MSRDRSKLSSKESFVLWFLINGRIKSIMFFYRLISPHLCLRKGKRISIKFCFWLFCKWPDEFYFIENTVYAKAIKFRRHFFQCYEFPGTGLFRTSLEFKYCYQYEEQWLLQISPDKATPITGLCGPEGSGRLRLQITRHSAQEGGKVVTLTHRPALSWYSFLEAESTPGHTEMSAATE